MLKSKSSQLVNNVFVLPLNSELVLIYVSNNKKRSKKFYMSTAL